MNNYDMALIGAVAHGHAAAIDESGFDPGWIEDSSAQAIIRESISLSRIGKPVNLINVMTRARTVPKDYWPQVQQVWANGYGDVDWRQVVDAIKSERTAQAVERNLSEALSRIRDPRHRHSHRQWLAPNLFAISTALKEGETYDARPSAHAHEQMQQIMFPTTIGGEFGDVFRGGYWDSSLILFLGLTKQGKSTTLYTIAADAIKQQKRVSFINTENKESIPVNRIIWALSDLDQDEIRTKKFKTPGREAIFNQWVEYCDQYLRVYPWDWLTPDRLERIATWDRPDLIVIDYLKKQPGISRNAQADDGVGDICDFIKNELCRSGVTVIGAGQTSDQNSQKLIKNDSSTPVPIYGTVRPQLAADLYILLKRDPHAHNMAYFRVWLDRIANRQDTVHRVPFNPHTWSLAMEHHHL